MDSPWLNTSDAAKYLKRGKRFVLREIHAGRLRAAVIGGRREILTRADWCEQYVMDQGDACRVASTGRLQRQRPALG